MKLLLFSLAAGALLAARPARAQAPDTIVVRLPNQAVLTLTVRDAAQLRELPKYHLDSLVARLGGYIRQAERAAETSPSSQVTMDFYPAQDQPGRGLPEQVRVTTRRPAPGAQPRATRLEAALDRAFGLKVYRDERGRKSYSSRPDHARRDSLQTARANRASKTLFQLDLGLNAFVNDRPYAPAPGLAGGSFDLRPLGSRYVSLSLTQVQRLGGRRSPLFASAGVEFAFNNYMLRNNNRWQNINGRTEIVNETSGRQYQKTKLATYSINVPLLVGLRFNNDKGKPTFSLAGGGFVGYLLGQHTKLKYFENGDTRKEHSYGSYNLNELQYGLQGQVGIGGLTLFAKYNMNQLFKTDRGPQTQVLSFGVRLLGD